MPTPFTVYTGPTSGDSTLTNELFAPGSGITASAIVLNASGQDAVNFYDGTLAPLGIGAGLLLTSGTTPGLANTVGWFGQDNSWTYSKPFFNGDADIDAVVNTVFQTQSYDATTLSFDFTVADPTATSVSFDLVFGSDEFPEWVDQFVDCAIVMVNGVNYALFNHDPSHPLSVVSSNLAAGYFQDNAGNAFQIEYDGVSHVLKIVAPIIPGGVTNHIKIGIADTGDHIYDSGVFLANFSAGNIPGSGVVSPTIVCDDLSNSVTGSAQDEYFDLKGGDDIAYAGAGDDIVVAGGGNDAVYGGSGADQLKGDAGDDSLDGGADVDTAVFSGASAEYSVASLTSGFTITDTNAVGSDEGTDTLTNVELAKFSDGLFSLGADGLTPVIPVTPPSNTPGIVFLSGIGGQGQTLTAQVSDADGVPASVTYAWQADGVDLGVTGNTFLVGEAEVGQDITVTASYTDLASHTEFLTSDPKPIAAPGDGDFAITLLILDAPTGASVKNPLTTLLQNAIDLGVSPIEASIIIKSALGFAGDAANIDLQHYDSYETLLANPGDATALAVEKKAVQVAVMTSLGGDETGMALTQAILLAHSNNSVLDLTDEAVILDVLGLVPADPNDPNDPVNKLVHEIWDRNANIGEATSVDEINTEWLDMQSGLSINLSDSIGDLSIHVNQAPTGSATADLANGLEGTDYIISASDLLQGFSDSDGGTLTVASLAADNGTVIDNGASFTITPALNYSGPVELTYTVLDGQGGEIAASQLFVVAADAGAVDNEATGTLGVTGAAEEGGSLLASLTGVSDADGVTTTAYQWQENLGGTWTDLAGKNTDTLAIPSDQSYVDKEVRVVATTTDALGGTTAFEGTGQTIVNVNDAPTGGVTINDDTPTQGQILTASNTLADLDGLGTISYQWKADGTDIGVGETYTLTQAEVDKLITVVASYTDGQGTAESKTSAATTAVANVEDEATGTLAVSGTVAEGATINADTTGITDPDGSFTATYQWQINSGGGWGDIVGEMGSSLGIPSDQSYVGKEVRVNATTTDSSGGTTDFTSVAQTVANVNDAPTGGVTINDDTPTQGQTLTASNTLADLDGLGAISYQWKADGTDIAVGETYTLTQAEVGKAITVTANYTDSFGTPETRTSLPTASVVAAGSGVTLTGTPGADTVNGGAGDDSLSGLAGNDTINGFAGNDSLIGGTGNDSLVGGDGNDVLDGGAGRDKMAGGAGDDTYYVDAYGDDVNEGTGAGTDTVVSKLAAYQLPDDVENLTLASTGAFIGIGNNLANTIVGNAAANVLTGMAGNDTIDGGAGSDMLLGGAGRDVLIGGDGADILIGGAGADMIDLTEGTAAADTVVHAGAADSADTITGFAFGSGADRFDFIANLKNGTTGPTSNLSAIAPVSVASNATASANGVIFRFAGAGDEMAAGSTAANAVANAVAALTSSADFSSANIAAADSLLLMLDDGANSFLFHYMAAGAVAVTEAADLTLIGIFDGVQTSTLATGDVI